MELDIREVSVSSRLERAGYGATNVVTVLHRPTGISVTVRGERSEHRAYAIGWQRLEKIVKMAKPIDWKGKQRKIVYEVCLETVDRVKERTDLRTSDTVTVTSLMYEAIAKALALYHKELVK